MTSATQETVATSNTEWNASYLCLAGYSLFLAWIWVCLSTSIIYPLAGSAPTAFVAPRLIAYLSDAIALLALAFLCMKIEAGILGEKRVFELAGSAFGLVSVGLLLLSRHFGGTLALATTIIGWLFCGIAGAICTFVWIRLFCKIDLSDLCLCISGAIILGAAVTYVLCYLPLPVTRAITAFLPAVSFALYCQVKDVPLFTEKDTAQKPCLYEKTGVSSSTARILVGIFVYALVFAALVNPLTTRNGVGIEADGGFMLLASFFAGAAIIVTTRMASRIDKLRTVYLVVLPLMVITLVILPFVQELPLNAAGFLGAFSFKLFDAICWILVYDSALRNRIAPHAAFSCLLTACSRTRTSSPHFASAASSFLLSLQLWFLEKAGCSPTPLRRMAAKSRMPAPPTKPKSPSPCLGPKTCFSTKRAKSLKDTVLPNENSTFSFFSRKAAPTSLSRSDS